MRRPPASPQQQLALEFCASPPHGTDHLFDLSGWGDFEEEAQVRSRDSGIRGDKA